MSCVHESGHVVCIQTYATVVKWTGYTCHVTHTASSNVHQCKLNPTPQIGGYNVCTAVLHDHSPYFTYDKDSTMLVRTYTYPGTLYVEFCQLIMNTAVLCCPVYRRSTELIFTINRNYICACGPLLEQGAVCLCLVIELI